MAGEEQEAAQRAVRGCSLFFGIGILITAFVLGGVFRTPVVVSMPGAGDVTDAIRFEEQFTARHWLFGLIQGKQADVGNAVAKYLEEGDELVELLVMTRHTGVDILITGITLSIYAPKTVTVRGTIQKKAAEPAPEAAETEPPPE